MKYTVAAFIIALATSTVAAQEEGPDEFPFNVLPAVNPAELQQLAALGDAELLSRLFSGAAPGRAPVLEKFFPPGTQIFPMSHGFAGPQEACMRARSSEACRLHLQDLQAIQSAKQPPPGLSNNPFARPR